MKYHILIFTRYPTPGISKTRLAPAVGETAAAELHRKMAEHTVATVKDFTKTRPCSFSVYFRGGDLHLMQNWLGPNKYHKQCQGSLGKRLVSAFSKSFHDKATKVIAIGTDCPSIDTELLDTAFTNLNSVDVVIGPAHDGGYYLIGLCKPQPELFNKIAWGTNEVLPQTIQKIEQNNLTSFLLKPLHDIDRPEDIKYLNNHSNV